MKVLLLRPPIYSRNLNFPEGPRFGVPISLLYLGAVVEEQGHEVVIYDALIDFEIASASPDKTGTYHIGAKWEEIAGTVAAHQPDVVGITNPFADFAAYAIRTSHVIDHVLPNVPIILGGPYATSSPQTFISEQSRVDYIVRGEGERSFPALLAAIDANGNPTEVAGVTYWDASVGTVVSNPMPPFIKELDKLPLPAYHLVDMERYFTLVRQGFPSRYSFEYPGSDREISIITSRGCPFNCVFCGNHLHMGRKWRFHSVEYVLGHMQHLIEIYNIRHFHIEDDNVALVPERFEYLLDGICSRGWDITWDTPNGVRPDRLSFQLLKKARMSGCTYLVIGIESGNQDVLDTVIKKNLNLENVVQNVQAAHRIGLDMHAFYVVGFPGETHRHIKDTFGFALKLLSRWGVVPHLCLARPLPGTKLFDISLKNGFLTESILPDIGKGRGEIFERQMIHTQDFSPADLEQWVARFNRPAVCLLAINIFLWCLRHPSTWHLIILLFWKRKNMGIIRGSKDLLFRVLIFKQNLIEPRMVRRFYNKL